MKASLIVAIANLLLIFMLAGEQGNLPIGQPRWVVMTVQLQPVFEGFAALAVPILTMTLAVRDYRRGARWQGVLAGVASSGMVLLGVRLWGSAIW